MIYYESQKFILNHVKSYKTPICNRAVGSSSLSTSTIPHITSCANQLNCKQIACLQVIGDVQTEKHI